MMALPFLSSKSSFAARRGTMKVLTPRSRATLTGWIASFSTAATMTTTTTGLLAFPATVPQPQRQLPVIKTSSSSIIYNTPWGNIQNNNRSSSYRHARLASTTTTQKDFVAPEPPESSGIAVFPDVQLTNKKDNKESPHATLRNSDPNAVFVVNGASRGIGLQFVKHLMSTTNGKIFACCRSPDTASELQEYLSSLSGNNMDRIELVTLDLEDQSSIENAGKLIREKVDRVDLLLNVAGILGDSKTTPGPERSVTKIERPWMEKTFQVNVIGPVMFSQELVPLLGHRRKKQQPKNDDGDITYFDRPNAVIANLSARVGSISDNGLGGWYSYRMSKSALNQATRTLANELKRQNVWCLALHPGTTNTDLSKPFQNNVQDGRLFPVEFTVDQLKQVIDCIDEQHTGGLFDWAGKAIPF
mmetsp:Transcript_10507/g.25052  ORF Transcript_10507/g.25052 Transcript_10507/m.25052 type:complete len:416 (+) Transcript_10507:93-1340(+)